MTATRVNLRLRRIVWGCAWFFLAFAPLHAAAAEGQPASIVGSWKLYRDDDHPAGPIDNETIVFSSAGEFATLGDSAHRGHYRVHGSELQMFAKVGARSVSITREIKFSAGELWMKNRKAGWAYYRRVRIRG